MRADNAKLLPTSEQNTDLQGKALTTADELMKLNKADEVILIEANPAIKAKKSIIY